MGSSSSKEQKMESSRRTLIGQIEFNKAKLNSMKEELTKLEMKIENLESDLVENKFVLNDIEQKNKAVMISEMQKERSRMAKSIKHLSLIKETMENNLEIMEMKIQEYKVAKNIKEANAIFNDIENMNFGQTYKNNANILKKLKKQEDKNMEILEKGNEEYLKDGKNEVEESPGDISYDFMGEKPAPL